MRHATFSQAPSAAISPSPFRALFSTYAAVVRGRSSIMIGLVRAAVVCATMALGLVAAQAADKAFKRDDLADSAIKLEAQIKSEAGPGAQTTPTPRTQADTAFNAHHFPGDPPSRR